MSANAVEIRQEYSRAFSGVALSVTPSQRAAIEKLPYVRRVHPDLPVSSAGLEPGVALIRSDEVWRRLGARGAGVVVAILDTGVDYRHSALGEGFGPGFKVMSGYDFVNEDADPMDDSGHGTHVAGIIAGNSSDLSGVAPDASLIAYKVLDNNGSGWTSDILAAIERTVDPNGDGDLGDHVAVANMSLGAPGNSDDAMSRAVDSAVSAGVVFVVAAGNLGRFQSVSSPGTADAAITVGATNFQDALASFTSKGPPAARYGIKPDVVAPGVDVRSAKAGGGTLVASGTSMAAPHVAGAAALLRSLHPEWTPSEVKSALVTTAAPIAEEVMAAGAGRIDAFRAATLTTRVMPAQLAFGIIDGKAAAWSGTRKIIVTNRGTAPQTYDFVTTGARDGVRVDVDPATVSLEPGASAEVAIGVSVENAKVAYAAAGSLSYSGFVEMRSANDVLRVPWAFVKAARLRVRYTDDDAAARVFVGGWTAPPTRLLPSIGRNLFEMLVAPGSYSLIAMTFAEVAPYRETTMVVRDEQFIDGERELDLSPTDAPYRLTFTANDEDNRPLRREGSDVECLPFRYLMFHTQAFGHRGLDLLYSTGDWRMVTSYPPDIRTSSITDRYSFVGGEVCLDATRSKFYVLEYAPIRGVSADVTRQAGGTELRAQKTRFLFPPTSDGLRMLELTGRFIDGPSPEPAPGFLLYGWPSPVWNGTVFLARSADPDLALRPVFAAQTDQAWIGTHPLRAIDGGVASFSTWTPSPTTFVATPTDSIAFGLGPVIPKLAFTDFGNGAQVQAQFSGPLDEQIAPANPVAFRLFDRDGRLQREETNLLTIEDLSQPIRIEIEALRTHDLQTYEGRSLLSARFGGTQADPFPPSLTTLAVLDARSQPTNELGRGLPARLRFSAIDVATGTTAPGRVNLEATRVWVRPTGTEAWRPVPVIVRGEDFDDPATTGRDPVGTIFECALGETAKEEGVFDLRVSVEDASANSIETTFRAAFAVHEVSRRTRAARH